MKDQVESGSCEKARRGVLRYARRLGWNVTGMPDHGAIIDVLAGIIALVERRGMRLGRWRRCTFEATYGAFVGKRRPRSCSRHGWFPMHAASRGGVRADSQACLDLLDYERRLRAVSDADWAAARKEAVAATRPRKKGKGDAPGTAGAAVGPATDAKPCARLGYCPYGTLVERFPLLKPGDPRGCGRFGHVCPVFIVAERACEARDGLDAAQGTATADA